jgi:hypothetical protein
MASASGVTLGAVRELCHERDAYPFGAAPGTLAEPAGEASEFAAADVLVRAEVKAVWALGVS